MDDAEQHERPPRAGKRVNPRRCSASGEEIGPEEQALRFVLDPEGQLTLDLKGKLPGRGAWVRARREDLLMALKKNGFNRSLKGPAKLPQEHNAESFADQVGEAIEASALARLGLARKSGHLVIGGDHVRKAAKKGIAYLTPNDVSEPETAKLAQFLAKSEAIPHLPLPAARHPVSIALGQDTVHVLLLRGGPSEAALSAVMLWRSFAC
ncbi:DUF448 domain-containing protein [Parvularcula sp. ZS-1/3]|uniref:DUF448 domain-containing protein n=1 Tax=Parvularcula mediterranea TaxID=2732508 RepID=A0A7Y3RKE9_9PROT|nr:DUF448 domain-containing protein [Parvularcula mediterranea]NNU15707.1 DUF448 domain-containing protein [Parvularcula mediterranea]